MAHIRVGEELFNVAVSGPRDAPVLLLSNSLGTDMRMWDPQMPELTKQFRVIRYDSRGHGESVAEAGAYTIDRLGRDALAVLDKLGVDKAHFVGLSMGGMVGMWLLSHAPARINRAVLANTSAHMGMPDIWNARAQQAQKDGMAGLAAPTLERWFTPGFRKANPKVMADIRDMIVATPPQGYAGCCLAIRDMDQRAALKSIRKPVLVIVGARDPATTPDQGKLIAESIPGARLIELPAAHLSNVEAPEAFAAAVVGFLSGRAVGELTRAAAAEAPPAPAPAAKPAAAPKPAPAPTPAPPAPVAAAEKPRSEPRKVAAKSHAAPAKRAASKKPAAAKKSPAKKKAAARKAASKSAAAKSRGAAARKPATSKKALARKSSAKKTSAKKSAAKKRVTPKSAAKKPARKAAGKKKPAKKPARRPAARGRRR